MKFCDGGDSVSMFSSQQAIPKDAILGSINGGFSTDRPNESHDFNNTEANNSYHSGTAALLGMNKNMNMNK